MGKRERYFEDRIIKSYDTYLDKRAALEDKGYALYEPLSKSEYVNLYKLASSRGDRNIARTFAEEDKYFKYSEARRIYNEYKDFGIMTPREIVGIDPSLLADGQSPRQAVFLSIWDMEKQRGLDSDKARKRAEEVLYG